MRSVKLEQLEVQAVQLREKLGDIRDAIHAEEEALVKQEYGVSVGSVVQDAKGIQYQVCAVHPMHGGAWLKGFKRRKDGTFGSIPRNLYGEWKLVTDALEPQP